MFALTMFTTFLLLLLFVLPYEGPEKFAIPLFGLYFLTNTSFIAACFKDPGYVKKSEKISFLKLNQYFDPSFICPTCEILRP